ncbi:hypothetical protein FK530_22590 [Tsukamurella conjunctivitidis]|uniref:Uncharacterized protein n=1 Tax=Tsukamurella conjunctivitidis TaxID=2592068 RepID=A0A5C5RSV1_9ACTN|nr:MULTISPECIES: hypothetical protein [Tsukamurella]TWS25628.1 hypothetical protein FK530_22590 [Tsukamurella conjunctivitidis]
MDGRPRVRRVVAPTGWDRESVRVYAEFVIARDDQLGDQLSVRVKLQDEEPLPNLTTRWTVVYVTHHSRTLRRHLSVVKDERRA